MAERMNGWSWFEPQEIETAEAETEIHETSRAFARAFAGKHGQTALDHLKLMTAGRFLGPDAPDAMLRHLEGQRHLVAYIEGLVERGRSGQ